MTSTQPLIDSENERYLLACATIGFPEAVEKVQFGDPVHKALADLIRETKLSGIGDEHVLIRNAIQGHPDGAILRALLADLVTDATQPTQKTIESAKRIVNELSDRRLVRDAGIQLVQTAEGNGDLHTLVKNLPDLLRAGVSAATVPKFDFAELDARRIRLEDAPSKPQSVFSLVGQQIATAGNLTVVTAQSKAGKSSVIGAMIAAVIAADDDRSELVDTFQFEAAPTNGKAVLLFDTEQSRYDAWTLLHRSVIRAEVHELPPHFRGYSLVDIPTASRRLYLAAEMERASRECGGLHSVIVDGVADICTDPNDAAEAFGLIDQLVRLAVSHDVPLVLVLHENPSGNGADYSKGRGHLGSQLERKAESNLRVLKAKDGTSVIFSDRCRRASIPKDIGPRFAWDDSRQMHVTVAADVELDSKADEKRLIEQTVVDAVFGGAAGAMAWSELKKRLIDVGHMSGRTAERRIGEWAKMGLIHSPSKGEYSRK